MIAALGFALPVAVAWIWLSPSWMGTTVDRHGSLRAVLALALGTGAASLVTSWAVFAGVAIGPLHLTIDLVLWLALGSAGLARVFRDRRTGEAPPAPADGTAAYWWAARLVFLVVAVLAAGTAAREYLLSPHGEWDAWAVWNQKARFLVRGGERWVDQLSLPWSNPSHPLLLPMVVARAWMYDATEATVIPAGIAALFGVGSVLTVMSAIGLAANPAWLAGAVVVAPALFVQQIMTQQADVPVAFFAIASTVMLLRADTLGSVDAAGARRCLALCGFLAGCSAWTKNEGMLFTAALVPALVWVVRRTLVTGIAWWIAGLAAPLLTLAWFKLQVAPIPPPYFEPSQVPLGTRAMLALSEQGLAAAHAMAREAMTWGGPGASGVALLAVAAAALRAVRSSHAALTLSIVVLMVLGYFAVFMVSPLDAEWLVRTTFYRLVTQVWPLLVLAAFGGLQARWYDASLRARSSVG